MANICTSAGLPRRRPNFPSREKKSAAYGICRQRPARSATYLRLIERVKGRIIGNVAIAALSSACEFVPYLAIARVAQLSITGTRSPVHVLAMWVLVAVAGAAAGRMLFSMATGRCHYADADFRVDVRTVLIEHLGEDSAGMVQRQQLGAGEASCHR